MKKNDEMDQYSSKLINIDSNIQRVKWNDKLLLEFAQNSKSKKMKYARNDCCLICNSTQKYEMTHHTYRSRNLNLYKPLLMNGMIFTLTDDRTSKNFFACIDCCNDNDYIREIMNIVKTQK